MSRKPGRPVRAKARARTARRRGLTLLEVLLSLSLIILMLSGIFGVYMTTLQARKEGSQIARDVLQSRALLERIADEIRHATDIVPGDGIGFRGDKHSITIVRTRLPENYAYTEYDDTILSNNPPPQLDQIRIIYELRQDPTEVDAEGVPIVYGLVRTQQKVFDPNPEFTVAQDADSLADGSAEDMPIEAPPVESELYAPEIKYLRFQYHDGTQWRDQWQVQNDTGGLDLGKAAATGKETYALPQAVMITIGRVRIDPRDEKLAKQGSKEEEDQEIYHPDRLTIVVHVLQSDPSLISSHKYGVADQLGRTEGLQ
jgi:hypothetical protein